MAREDELEIRDVGFIYRQYRERNGWDSIVEGSKMSPSEPNDTPAKNNPSRLPVVSLVVAGASFLGIPIGMSSVWAQGEFRAFCFVALLVALASVVLGITGFIKTRGEQIGRRVPAIIATGVGGILSLIYALVFWLSTPF